MRRLAGLVVIVTIGSAVLSVSVWAALIALPPAARHFHQAFHCQRPTTVTRFARGQGCAYRTGRVIAVFDVSTKPAVSLRVQWSSGQQTDVALQRDDNPLGDPFYVLHPQAQPLARLHERITLQEWVGTTTGAILHGRYYMTADNPDYALRTARAMILLAALVSVVGVRGILVVARRRWRARKQSKAA